MTNKTANDVGRTSKSENSQTHNNENILTHKEQQCRRYVEALGISAENTRMLFRLLDRDESKKIDLEVFCLTNEIKTHTITITRTQTVTHNRTKHKRTDKMNKH